MAPTYRADVAGKIRAALADYVSARPDVLTAAEKLFLARMIEREEAEAAKQRAALAETESEIACYRAQLAELEN